jgi:hypothetical protein
MVAVAEQGRGVARWLGVVLAALLSLGPAAGRAREPAAAVDAGPIVPLRIGPHSFRIPRNYVLHPPHPSGVDHGFGLRALMPDMAPMTETNRHVFQTSSATEEGGRVVRILFEIMPDRPRDDARWRLGNVLRSYSAVLGDFVPPSEETHGLYALAGPPIPNVNDRRNDLFWGELPMADQFVAISCESASSFRVQSCTLWTDWQGRTVQVRHVRRNLTQWREIATAGLALMDRFAIDGPAAGTNTGERQR